MSLAITCASGGYRVIFAQGVLSAFESAGLRADAYAGTSASVVPAAFAALNKVNEVGLDYSIWALKLKETSPNGMSGVILSIIERWSDFLKQHLFTNDAPRLFVPASAVITGDGAAQTQGDKARALGRKLLLSAARGDHSWVDENLELRLFDTHGEPRLTPENFDEVTYASTRMMHAWDVPAWINGQPYVDASYTCACPAVELAEHGFDEVIAISNTTGTLYRDIFGDRVVPDNHHGAKIHIVAPEINPKELGADFTDATEAGLRAAFNHGVERGRAFLDRKI